MGGEGLTGSEFDGGSAVAADKESPKSPPAREERREAQTCAAASASGRCPPVIITMGEPAGVGPDICFDILRYYRGGSRDSRPRFLLVGDRAVFEARARRLGLAFNVADIGDGDGSGHRLMPCPSDEAVVVGSPSPANAASVLRQLDLAAAVCERGEAAGMVTAPVSKLSILAAGHKFVGVTEYLARRCGREGRVVMLMESPRLRVALATTHLPLREVIGAISIESVVGTLRILTAELPKHFRVGRGSGGVAHIRVCGINPHAGEGGYMGDEEVRILAPAIAAAAAEGMRVSGPYSADTLMLQAQREAYDCVLAMYHDQALPAVKLNDFNNTINVTLGLPFLRASPDHGIAADIAGKRVVSPYSMLAATRLVMANRSAP